MENVVGIMWMEGKNTYGNRKSAKFDNELAVKEVLSMLRMLD